MKPQSSVFFIAVLIFLVDLSVEYSEHSFGGRTHSNQDDHIAFLGEKMAKEFDKLSPQESRRRLRYVISTSSKKKLMRNLEIVKHL